MLNLKPLLLITFLGVISPLGYSVGETTHTNSLSLGIETASNNLNIDTDTDRATGARIKATKEQTTLCGTLPTLTELTDMAYQHTPNGDPVDEKTRAENSWSKNRHSSGITISPDGYSLYRHPRNEITDVCISDKTYGNGVHIWRLKWPRNQSNSPPFKMTHGTHAVIGIASNNVSVFDANKYMNLIGSKELSTHSFGWDIKNNKIISNGNILKSYPEQDANYEISTDMALILNMNKKTLSFYDIENDKFLGVAVTDLEGEWSPAISSVWGQCRIYLKYCGDFKKQPLSLQETCKRSINQRLKARPEKEVQNTNLPKPLQKYLAAPYDSPLDGSDGQAADFP